jgi:hypothetical protein
MNDSSDHNESPWDDDPPLPQGLELAMQGVMARVLADHYLLPKEEQSTKEYLRPRREEWVDWIAEIREEGRFVGMASGAQWEVASADRTVVLTWLPQDEVLIYRTDLSPTHPYELLQLEFVEVVQVGLVKR